MMKRVIVDYSKLTEDILNMLVDKYPNGYGYKDIITLLEETNKNSMVTFKILPRNSNFIIGSDNAIYRGEILSC